MFFMQIVKMNSIPSKSPLVVHCSAGVGRTGTLIAIENLSEKALSNEKVDVLREIQKLREERVNFVQTSVNI